MNDQIVSQNFFYCPYCGEKYFGYANTYKAPNPPVQKIDCKCGETFRMSKVMCAHFTTEKLD